MMRCDKVFIGLVLSLAIAGCPPDEDEPIVDKMVIIEHAPPTDNQAATVEGSSATKDAEAAPK
jgi:hypothetical protein